MLALPDVEVLYRAADAIDATAARVEADMATVTQLVDGLPWHGPRRSVASASAVVAAGTGRRQATAERDLARALRRLARETEAELRVLADLAARARSHLEGLLRRAEALVVAAAGTLADATASVGAVMVEVLTFDPAAAVREARVLAEQAADRMRSITARLHSLPVAHDPQWRHLGPDILGWRPL